MKKDTFTSLQEHAIEVSRRLVSTAYTDLPEKYQHRMMLETFCNTLGNAYLRHHLLAVATSSIEDTVITGNEFLQIQPEKDRPRIAVRQVDGKGDY